ncbi:acetate/propionate family kinase [Nocardioides pacificus]
MDRLVLVLNTGSSSLKYQLVDADTGEAGVRGHLERIGTTGAALRHVDASGETTRSAELPDHAAALETMRELLESSGVGGDDLLAIGHRVVHGGSRLTEPVLIDDDVLAEIERLSRLAPLHNPPAAAGIRSARSSYPDVAQVAVFDTAFFSGLPAAAAVYPIEQAVAERLEIRRYGMHGTSHQYVAGEVAAYLGRPLTAFDQIVLHLGNGASAAAIRGGRPADTSMGLTPLEGLMMGTRAGDLDPGVLLHLLRHGGYDADGLEELLTQRSGLEGMAGVHDFRELLEAIDARDPGAVAAYAAYCHRIRKYVGAYLAVLDGADVVAFTGGVGEHNPALRADCLIGLDRLGIEVDPARNEDAGEHPTRVRRISTDTSRVAVLVVPTNEELAIARQAAALVG